MEKIQPPIALAFSAIMTLWRHHTYMTKLYKKGQYYKNALHSEIEIWSSSNFFVPQPVQIFGCISKAYYNANILCMYALYIVCRVYMYV